MIIREEPGVEMGAKILVIGSSNTDMVITSNRLPAPGETVIGERFEIFSGGKGANQAVAAARAGGDVTFAGAVGDDTFGAQTIENLRAEGIDVSHLKIVKGVSSGVALIMVDSSGENAISIAPSANHMLTPEDVANIDFTPFSYVVMQLEIPLATVQCAAEKAKSAGASVILNPTPAAPMPEALLAATDILIPNKRELGVLAGKPIESLESAVDSARTLLRKESQCILVTLGAEGAVYINAHHFRKISSLKVRAIDTVGAGDCFIGCLTAALGKGKNHIEAIKFATAAATLSIQKRGAQNSLPHLNEIEKLIEHTY